MALFSRRKSATTKGDPIESFWSWWQDSGGQMVAAAIGRKEPLSVVPDIAQHVKAIDAGLDWELGSGLHAEHVLVVTAAGKPELRSTARRWLRSAPPPDQTWEYADLRRPAPGGALTLEDGPHIPVSEAWVAIETDPNAAAVHVGLHHEAFDAIDERQRQIVTFLILDAVLGEEMVETWLGAIEVLTDRPDEARPISDLLGAVAAFAREYVDEDGNPSWALLEGQTSDGQRLVASIEIPLRPMRLPHLDTHVGMAVAFDPVRDDGLPETPALDALRELEDHLSARIGDSGRLLAHETSRGTRLFHFYVDGTTPAGEQLRVAAGGWHHGRVGLDIAADPAWERVSHLRG